MSPEKIKKLKVDIAHVGGGFLIGIGLTFLYDVRTSDGMFHCMTNLAMFLTLLLLGLSYLGE